MKVTVTKVTENSSKVTENEVTLPEKLPETLGRLIEKMTEKHDRLIGNLDKLIEKLIEKASVYREYGTDGAFVWITFKRPNSITNSVTLTQHIEESGQKTTQKTTQKLTKKQEEILSFLKNNPNASRKDLTENIEDLTEDGVKYNLKRLKELELIRRVGPDKGGFWEIIE